jgi:hypothetical protein
VRNGACIFLTLAVLAVDLAPAARAQEPDFDPRDLSGIWSGSGGGGGAVPYGSDMPAMTPEGMTRYLTNIPTRTEDTRLNPSEDPALSNDPTFACNPRGFPRTMYDTNVRLFELIHLQDRVLQLLQRERTLREFWMDGRELPTPESMDNIGPSWYGHSVAEWDGDTLVVNTIGMDDRAWLDSTGHVKSFEARVEERYRRIGPDTIELRMALYDPTYYTEPWEAETRIFEREPRERITYFGWYGIFSGITDLMCAPMNAIERFREGAY